MTPRREWAVEVLRAARGEHWADSLPRLGTDKLVAVAWNILLARRLAAQPKAAVAQALAATPRGDVYWRAKALGAMRMRGER